MNNDLKCMGSRDCPKIVVVEREYRGFEPLLPKLRGIYLCNEHKDKWPWDDPQDILKEIKLEALQSDS